MSPRAYKKLLQCARLASTLRLSLLVSSATLWAGCGPVQPLTKSVDPDVRTMAVVNVPIQDPACTATVPIAMPRPQTWWNNLTVGQPPKVAGEGVVGFHLVNNATTNCPLDFRQDLYRTVFSYNLQPNANLKGLVRKAEFSISAEVLPALRPGFFCEAFIGAGGGLIKLGASTVLPASEFVELPGGQAFPPGSTVFSFPQPWAAGQVAPGVTSADAGGQRAVFTVDVTAVVTQSLDAGVGALFYAITGTDEGMRPTRPPADFDCRTVYKVQQLVITHL